jgi:phosphatidylglycerol:prolipoprotein diacylglycerol transferase
MFPILDRLGGYFIYSFTAVWGIGILLALAVTWRVAKPWRTPHSDWWDGAMAAGLMALIGGRMGYWLGQWAYFAERPSAMWQVWAGGFSYTGALLGGLLGLWGWCRWRQRPFAHYALLLSPGLALLSMAGWTACWLHGCAYGAKTTLAPWSANLADNYGVFAVRYQTQLLGISLSLLLFMALLISIRRRPSPRLFWAALLGVTLIQLLISRWRGDLIGYVGGAHLDTAVNLIIVLICLILLQYQPKSQADDPSSSK